MALLVQDHITRVTAHMLILFALLLVGRCVHSYNAVNNSFTVTDWGLFIFTHFIGAQEDAAIAYFFLVASIYLRPTWLVTTSIWLISMIVTCDIFSFHLFGVALTFDSLTILVTKTSLFLQNLHMLSGHQLVVSTFFFVIPSAVPMCICGKLPASKTIKAFVLPTESKRRISLVFFLCMILSAQNFVSIPNNCIVILMQEALQQHNMVAPPNLIDSELSFLESQEQELERQLRGIEYDIIADRPSVFLIMLESVRGNALPMYNEKIPATIAPFLSSLVSSMSNGKKVETSLLEDARLSVVNSMRTIMPNTMKALFASLCAVPPHPSPLWSEYSSMYLNSCLPHVLGRLGWSTRFFTSSTVGFQPRLGFEKSYGRVELATFQLHQQKKMRNKNSKSNSTLNISLWQGRKRFDRANFLGFDERIMNLPIASWLRRLKQEQQRKPAFGVISSVTTHAPYTTANASRCDSSCWAAVKEAVAATFAKTDSSSSSKKKTRKHPFAKYLSAIHDTDDWLRDILQIIDKSENDRGGYVIIVVGDHGEAFGERIDGGSFHGGAIYDESVKVPCIILDKRKSKKRGSSYSGRVNKNAETATKTQFLHGDWANTDLRATLLYLLGFNVSKADLNPPESLPHSRNIFESEQGKEAEIKNGDSALEAPICSFIISSLVDKYNTACVRRHLKLIQHGEAGQFRIDLFNTTADPEEQHPLTIHDKDTMEGSPMALRVDTGGIEVNMSLWDKNQFLQLNFAAQAPQEAQRYRELAAMRINLSQRDMGKKNDADTILTANEDSTTKCFLRLVTGACPGLNATLGTSRREAFAAGNFFAASSTKEEGALPTPEMCAAIRNEWLKKCSGIVLDAELATNTAEAGAINNRRRLRSSNATPMQGINQDFGLSKFREPSKFPAEPG